MGAAGEAGSSAGGAPTTDPPLVYGVDAQSCKGGLECPGGGSCCRRFEVPAGTFQMGTSTDTNAASDEMPPHTTTLRAFELEEFEVTVGRFRRFVELYDGSLPEPGSGALLNLANSGWRTEFAAQMPATRAALEDQLSCSVGSYQAFTAIAGVRETLPINCVSWYVALAFCIWDGGRLPTEAEWEMASAGGDENRLYPWGATTPNFAVHAVANCMGDGVAGCSPADVLPVGSRPAGRGRFGQHDLGGSLWEWVFDYYDATYYQAIGTCSNCANLSGLTPRVIRGGNFTSLALSLRATGRASKPPNAVDPYAGFRCAHSL
jgi:formylglycine-generating enzyme required for sulfatase activity